MTTTAAPKTRVHYMPNCKNLSGKDRLALTSDEAAAKVNCSDCVREMYAVGLLSDEEN